jgi:hypothetical protein
MQGRADRLGESAKCGLVDVVEPVAGLVAAEVVLLVGLAAPSSPRRRSCRPRRPPGRRRSGSGGDEGVMVRLAGEHVAPGWGSCPRQLVGRPADRALRLDGAAGDPTADRIAFMTSNHLDFSSREPSTVDPALTSPAPSPPTAPPTSSALKAWPSCSRRSSPTCSRSSSTPPTSWRSHGVDEQELASN